MSWRSVYLAIPILLVFCAGCDKAEPVVEVLRSERAGVDLTADERIALEAAAREFAASVRGGRGNLVADRFDLDAFVREVLHGLPVSQRVWDEFAAGVRTGLEARPGGLLADSLGQDFRFIRLLEEAESTQMLFRVWDEAAGVNYMRGVVDRPGGEGWRLIDIFSYSAGETMSESMRRTYLPMLLAESGSALGEEEERLLLAGYNEYEKVISAFSDEDFVAARRGFDKVPQALREQRFGRILEIEILSRIDGEPEAYAAAMQKFAETFPDDPSLPLMMLEHHSIRGEHEEVLQRIDELDAMLGGDVFLHFVRVGALSALGREGEAVEGLRAAITAEPEIEELRWAMVHAALSAGEYDLVADALRVLKGEFDYEFSAEQLQDAEGYEAFVESEAGKKVLEELQADG